MSVPFTFLPLAVWLVLAACAVAVVTDLRQRRIPNLLTAALAFAALAMHFAAGWVSLTVALATLLGVAVLGFVAFTMRWLGGGDVKLLAASAAMLGFPDSFSFLLYTAIGGGVFALLTAAFSGRLRAVLSSLALLLRPLLYKGTLSIAPTQGTKLPYAVAIAIGALAVALSHTAAPFLKIVR